jgi:ribonuclease Z
MEKIVMLGTGHAMVSKCYNTCFLIKNDNGTLLVDAGGGYGIIDQMEKAGEDWKNINSIFVTHAHTDHITGIVWVARKLSMFYRDGYDKDVTIYANDECISVIKAMCEGMLSSIGKEFNYFNGHLKLHTLTDGESFTANGMNMTAFDIGSVGKKQYGFKCEYRKGEYLVCLGDESYHDCSEKYVRNCDYLMHEAFSAESKERGPQHHGSARRAGQNAKNLNVKNLIMYHTEDRNLQERKKLYTEIASQEFDGGIYVPDDIEEIEL